MKPYVIMHMMASIDGRIVTTEWPRNFDIGGLYETVHSELAGDAWIVGRATMAEFAEGKPRPVSTTERFPRESWKAPGAHSGPYGVYFDRKGKLHLNRAEANGDPLVAILGLKVSDNHLAELRRDGISYVFAGEDNPAMALSTLAAEFGINRLLLEGGGGINGAFLAAGLIDEISLLVLPLTDGAYGMPTLIDRIGGNARALKLQSVATLASDVVHLRYTVAPMTPE